MQNIQTFIKLFRHILIENLLFCLETMYRETELQLMLVKRIFDIWYPDYK